jgi:hypothetical protein
VYLFNHVVAHHELIWLLRQLDGISEVHFNGPTAIATTEYDATTQIKPPSLQGPPM